MVLSQILSRPGDENSSLPSFPSSANSWDENILPEDLLRIVLPEQTCSAQSILRKDRKIIKKLSKKKMSDSSVLRDLTKGKKKIHVYLCTPLILFLFLINNMR